MRWTVRDTTRRRHRSIEFRHDDAALEKAVALLDRTRLRSTGDFRRVVTFESDVTGIELGMLVPINVSEYGLNGNFLVDQMQVRDLHGQKLWYVITALEAETIGGWQEFWRKMTRAMFQSGQQIVVRDNEVILLLRTFNDNVLAAESVVAASAAPDTTVGVAQVDFSTS